MAAFVAAYVRADGYIAGDTQTGYALALHMDLVPAALRPVAAARLVEAIEQKGGHLSTGIVGLAYLCPVLTDTGHADVAYRLLTKTTFPSWGYAIEHGTTTIWERWDGWTEDRGFQAAQMNSFNHYALGSVGAWLYRYVAGIDVDPEQPGYRHIIIRPHPGGDLMSARAEHRSMRGTIVSAWQTDSEVFQLDITIPANTTATVYLPVSDVVDSTEGGELIGATPGVRFLGMENGRVTGAVASGVYTFRCRAGKRQD